MKPFWKQLATLYHDIIYMIKHKKLDPNGAELNFIKDPYTNEQKATIDHQRRLAGNAIARAVDALERLHAMDKQVGIQFIRFGEDELGMKRLRYLDDQLPKEKERPLARDICDTTPANGNVWKMMLGSIDPYWDDDPD